MKLYLICRTCMMLLATAGVPMPEAWTAAPGDATAIAAEADAPAAAAAPAATDDADAPAAPDAPDDADAPAATDASDAPDDDAAPAVSPLERWLDKLGAKSKTVKSLHARVRYDVIDHIFDDKQRRTGTLVYAAGPPAMFAVHLNQLLLPAGDDKWKLKPEDRWFIFDGQWLAEKRVIERRFWKWQVVPPNANPAAANPLALGNGPFVVPINASKAELLKKFDIELVEPAEGDPTNSLHLKLKPKDKNRIKHDRIDLWYDRDTLLPQRARTWQEDAEKETIIDLTDVAANQPVDEKLISTAEPKERGWRVEVRPWESQEE